MTEQNKNEISWKSSEYPYYPKTRQWFILTGAGALIVLLFALWLRDLIMFFTLLLVFGVSYHYAVRAPKKVTIRLSGSGVSLSGTLYPYNSLKKFWIHYQPPMLKTVNFQTANYLNRDLTIQLDDQDPNEVRRFLLQYLPEDLHSEEAQSDRLLRQIKF
ncbi:MAG TPA: hypothetical protein VJK50_03000 [Patescibacteria group bacterium]|nr:hypothetical protein [Patescibacteria group bacterium]